MEYIKDYVDNGLITLRKHPLYDLWVTNYTAMTQYERHWDKVTTTHRGRIIDSNGQTVAPCLPKFFNYQEHQEIDSLPDVPVDENFVVYEKLDGSYISVTNHPDYEELIVASRGSFESDQAAWAQEIIERRAHTFPEGYTFIFELIHPLNRIVVDYGQTTELVLLSVFYGEVEVPLFYLEEHRDAFPHATQFRWASKIDADSLEELLNDDQENFEGYVVWFDSGLRVKVKLDEYVRLHKVVTNLTPKKVFEAVKEETIEEIIEILPDEYFDWVKDLAASITSRFELTKIFSKQMADEAESLFETRKEQAQWILSHERRALAPVVFNYLDGKNPDESAWKYSWKDFQTWPIVTQFKGADNAS